ncbi:MAG: septum formation initiator family protein [Defluviitaleaceae bacterium]|nr:septum formation initiator family protein [Defluviitaleaceae bacterium]
MTLQEKQDDKKLKTEKLKAKKLKTKKHSRRKLKLVLFIPFWLFLTATFGGVILTQAARREKYITETAQAQQELDKLQAQKQDLQNQVDFNTKDAAIEKAARDQLGLVYPDEIIFDTN